MQTQQETQTNVRYLPEANPQNDFEKLLTKDHKLDVVYDDNAYARTLRVAELMAASGQAVPKHFRNNKGMCFAHILQCHSWGISNYFASAWETYVEPKSDRLCFMAKLIIAVTQLSGLIKGGFKFEYKGEGNNLECRAGAVLANGDGSITWGEWRSISTVRVKNSPLWSEDPKQQFSYSRALSWTRLYHPEIVFGVYTADELDAAGEIGSKHIEEVDLSTPADEVDALIAELNQTKTPADQKLLRPRIEAVIGKDRSRALSAYSERNKFFKAQAKAPEPTRDTRIDAFLTALDESGDIDALNEVWSGVPDELGENEELVSKYSAMADKFEVGV